MGLVKQGIDISFAQGLDTKTDPKRVMMGKFLRLENSVFNKGGLFQKRNGYALLSSLPNNNYSYLTTFKDNLTAIGSNIAAYNSSNATWVSKGTITPLSINTLAVLKNSYNQTAVDSVTAANGLTCTVYLETISGTTTNKYAISDSITGQNIVSPTAVPNGGSGTISGGMRVFLLGNSFVIAFTNTISAVPHLQFIQIPINNPSIISVTNTNISSNYSTATTLSWDGYVLGNILYFAYNTTSGGQAVKATYITTASSMPVTAVSFTGYKASMMTICADTTQATPTIYFSWYNTSATVGYTAATDQFLNLIMNPVQIIASGTILNLASAAQNGSCTVFSEVSNAYPSPGNLATNYINKITVTPIFRTFTSVFSSGAGTITASSATGLVNGMYLIDNTTPANIAAGTTFTISGTTLTLSSNTAGNSAGSPGDTLTAATLSSVVVCIRSVGLASKAFLMNSSIYFLSSYSSAYQPTYFLINGSSSTSASPVICAKLAYENGGGYLTLGLPGVSILGSSVSIPYLFKDLISGVNKTTDAAAGTQINQIYAQTGINVATLSFGTNGLITSEIGNDLHITGGFLSMYDGYLPVEHNFFLWLDPENSNPTANAVWSTTGGNIHAQPDGATNTNVYWYVYTYEWTDNQGNTFRSAPSVPVPVTTTGSGTSGSIALNIPTLRLTMKVANPVKIVVYRWSIAQQIYYQMTTVSNPLQNDTTVDNVNITDTSSDSDLLTTGNILYTTGGVMEDINAPASNVIALFDSRLWLVDAEDQNLLWFSKQVIEATPVEMSDLFTIYIPPTTSTQGNTGPIRTLFPMDDKLIIGKNNSFFYINGTGPDNTGANNQYSQAIFITATVGCSNQKSFVLIPNGLMFQSDKGIWLLDRGLNTSYIGAPVEDFTTGATVLSAVNIPETNQVRFTLDTGITLMYDYYYDQWGTFTGVPCVSSCIFEEMHTFINSKGSTFQERSGTYIDGANPVLMMFETGPLRIGDLQNYQRAYFFYLLGTYLSPHQLYVSLTYDYESSPSQSILISPTNYSTPFGSGSSQSPYGQGTPFGGGTNLENWRVFLERQRCMAFAIKIQEIYDASLGVPAGAGLTLSGLNLVMSFKKPFRPQPAFNTAG